MGSRKDRLAVWGAALLLSAAAVVSYATPSAAQAKGPPAKPPAAAKPAAPAAKPAAPAAKPAAPAAKPAAPPAKPLAPPPKAAPPAGKGAPPPAAKPPGLPPKPGAGKLPGKPGEKPGAAPPPTDPKEQAKEAYKQAQEKFDANDFAAALPLFQQADQLYPGAAPKHKVAVCLDKLGRVPEAIASYRAFIDSNPGDKYADRIAESQRRIMELEATIPAVVTVRVGPPEAATAPLSITVDGVAAQGPELRLTAGQHQVVVSAPGYQPYTEVVTVRGGERRDMAVTLVPAAPIQPVVPPPPPPEEKPKEERSNIPAYVTLGIAGAGVVLGTVFGIQALSAKSDFDDDPTVDNADRAERAALIADMSFGVALTFGITGAVLLFSGGGDDEPEQAAKSGKPAVTPWASPNGGGMAASVSF
jgi:hypothetical protein